MESLEEESSSSGISVQPLVPVEFASRHDEQSFSGVDTAKRP